MSELIPIERIEVGRRHRALNQAQLGALVESIGALGLRTPITVGAARFANAEALRPVYDLVAGLHRLEACKQLGMEEIAAEVLETDALDRELWEIDENLCRLDLTALERAEHLLRRKQIFEAKGGSKIPTLGGEQAVGFAKATAATTGDSKRVINQALRRAEKIAPEIRARLHGTAIADNGAELDALAEMAPARQEQALAAVEAGEADSVRAAAEQQRRDARDAGWEARRAIPPQVMQEAMVALAFGGLSEATLAASGLTALLEDEEPDEDAISAWLAQAWASDKTGPLLVGLGDTEAEVRVEDGEVVLRWGEHLVREQIDEDYVPDLAQRYRQVIARRRRAALPQDAAALIESGIAALDRAHEAWQAGDDAAARQALRHADDCAEALEDAADDGDDDDDAIQDDGWERIAEAYRADNGAAPRTFQPGRFLLAHDGADYLVDWDPETYSLWNRNAAVCAAVEIAAPEGCARFFDRIGTHAWWGQGLRPGEGAAEVAGRLIAAAFAETPDDTGRSFDGPPRRCWRMPEGKGGFEAIGDGATADEGDDDADLDDARAESFAVLADGLDRSARGHFASLCNVWERATPPARAAFVAWLREGDSIDDLEADEIATETQPASGTPPSPKEDGAGESQLGVGPAGQANPGGSAGPPELPQAPAPSVSPALSFLAPPVEDALRASADSRDPLAHLPPEIAAQDRENLLDIPEFLKRGDEEGA